MKKSLRSLTILVHILLPTMGFPQATVPAQHVPMDRVNPELERVTLLPMTWGREPSSSLARLLQNSYDDPLLFGMDLITAIGSPTTLDDDSLSQLRDVFLGFLEQRNSKGYWHHDFYDPFPSGWYSSMDFASVALGGYYLSIALDDAELIEISTALVEQMIMPVEKGGTKHQTKLAKCWLGEFVWPNMGEDDQNFVINGFLFALEVLEIFARSEYSSPEMKVVRDCAVNDLKILSHDALYADLSWSYYMLQPLIPNQPHYIIYETNQFDALFAVTGNLFYRSQAEIRRAIFKQNFMPQLTDGMLKFTQLGGPHPFKPDLYVTNIKFLDNHDRLISESRNSFTETGENEYLLNGIIPAGATSYQFVVESGGSNILMYSEPIDAPALNESDVAVKFSTSTIFDAKEIEPGKKWVIERGDRGEARIMLALDQPLTIEQLKNFAIKTNVSSQISWGIGLRDEKDNEAFRYLPLPIPNTRKWLPLSSNGFEKIELIGDKIHHIALYLYPPSDKPVEFELTAFVLHNGQAWLHNKLTKAEIVVER